MGHAFRASLLGLLTLCSAMNTCAAAPVVREIMPRGLQAGATTTLVLDGAGLASDLRIVGIGFPIAKQSVKAGGKAERVEVEITLDPAVAPGVYRVHAATSEGLSPAQLIAIGSLPERALAAKFESLPVALSGAIAGGGVTGTSFTGKAGQRIVADVMARRLGAATDPMVRILDPAVNKSPGAPRGGRSMATLAPNACCRAMANIASSCTTRSTAPPTRGIFVWRLAT